MTLRLLISLSLLLAWRTTRAQTADEFFNGGAQFYVSNNIPAALERTENGLKLYPDDVKLKKLAELLKQQQQQQSQSRQSEQSKENQQSQQQQQNQQKEQEQQQSQSSAAQQKEKPEDKQQEEPPAAQAANQMTPQQARQLLDAQKDDERVLQFAPEGKPQDRSRQLKDW